MTLSSFPSFFPLHHLYLSISISLCSYPHLSPISPTSVQPQRHISNQPALSFVSSPTLNFLYIPKSHRPPACPTTVPPLRTGRRQRTQKPSHNGTRLSRNRSTPAFQLHPRILEARFISLCPHLSNPCPTPKSIHGL